MSSSDAPRPPEGFVRGNDRIAAALAADPELRSQVDTGIEQMRTEDRAYAMNLAAIRKASELTQVELAQRLGVTQGQVSRLEKQSDVLLSTLLSYLDAAGVQDVAISATVAGRHVLIDLGAIATR